MSDVLDDPLLTPELITLALSLPNVAAVYELTRKRTRDPLPAFLVGKYLRVRRSQFRSWVDRRAWPKAQLDEWLATNRAQGGAA
ncbi:MAG: hypothetical protein ABIR79_07310 [Candidatus Binatia bacterium]